MTGYGPSTPPKVLVVPRTQDEDRLGPLLLFLRRLGLTHHFDPSDMGTVVPKVTLLSTDVRFFSSLCLSDGKLSSTVEVVIPVVLLGF